VNNQKGILMKKLFLNAALAALTTFAATTAFADDVPKVLDAPLKAGMKVLNKFPAGGKLQGWVLSQGGQNSVVYTTADGKYLLAGALIDESGTNLTAQYAEKFIPKPEFDKLQVQLDKSAYIVSGAKGNAAKSTIYAFVDLNCGYCAMAYKALVAYEAVGLQVRWVPVAFLRPDSLTKAAALLESSNPEAALKGHELAFGGKDGASIKPVATVSEALAKKLDANGKLMREFGFNGTPGFVFKDKAGKVMTRNGMPRMSDLPTITGLPEQAQSDPDLARFK
jgi:thiol:disulfide interchange protein DsbG